MTSGDRKHVILASSTVIAVLLGVALLLRPSHTIAPGPELAAPERIPAPARAVIRSKMHRHADQLSALVASVVVLDYDGVARGAGEIFDEPELARPVSGEELNGLLPERFFTLQTALRAQPGERVRRSDQDLYRVPRRLLARRRSMTPAVAARRRARAAPAVSARVVAGRERTAPWQCDRPFFDSGGVRRSSCIEEQRRTKSRARRLPQMKPRPS